LPLYCFLLLRYQFPGRGISGKGSLIIGDSVSYGGVKITVVEAGDFGDVARVEPWA
jgi:hypothetical protein